MQDALQREPARNGGRAVNIDPLPAPASLSSAGEVEAGTTVGGGGPNEGVLGMLAGSELATTGIDRSKALPLTSNRPSMIVPQSEVVVNFCRRVADQIISSDVTAFFAHGKGSYWCISNLWMCSATIAIICTSTASVFSVLDAHATHHLGTGIPHFVPIITAFLLLLVEFLTQAFTIS
ncbi:hypothetical protein B0H13DRAFT_1895119 [Mycena leptocephala]|nr:hypothetical protein B0H13DRAFT_1895119 [Mycena leptocephala]